MSCMVELKVDKVKRGIKKKERGLNVLALSYFDPASNSAQRGRSSFRVKHVNYKVYLSFTRKIVFSNNGGNFYAITADVYSNTLADCFDIEERAQGQSPLYLFNKGRETFDSFYANPKENNLIIFYRKHYGSNQNFFIEQVSNDFPYAYRIKNQQSGRYLFLNRDSDDKFRLYQGKTESDNNDYRDVFIFESCV